MAGALEEKAIGRVEVFESLGGFKEVIEKSWTVRDKPELFCFGLLDSFDVLQLAALIAPRPVQFHEPSERVKTELAGLRAWYTLLGGKVELR